MKTKELRIGNYLYYEHTTHIVSGVHGNKVYSWWVKDGEPVIEYEAKDISGTQVENPYMDVVSQYEPIPLNEEWLEKFGFEERLGGRFFKHTWFYIDQDCAGVSGWYFRNIDGFKYKCEYIHQLQNLYFVLTGKELTLKQD